MMLHMQRVRRRLASKRSTAKRMAARSRSATSSASPGDTSCAARRSHAVRRPSSAARRATWRWATLWLTTLLLATNVPCAPSAAGQRGRDRLHGCEVTARPVPHRAREASRRGDAARPARARRTAASGRGTPRRRRCGPPRGPPWCRRRSSRTRMGQPSAARVWPLAASDPARVHPPANGRRGLHKCARPPADDPPTTLPPVTRSGIDRPPARVRAPCPSADGAAHRSGRRP